MKEQRRWSCGVRPLHLGLISLCTLASLSSARAQILDMDGSKSTTLSPRQFSAVAHNAKGEEFLLFGGTYGYDRFDDTWILSSSGWIEQSPKTHPMQRVLSAAAYDSGHSEVVLFGGRVRKSRTTSCSPGVSVESLSAELFCEDTWVWDGKDWQKKEPPHSPSGREAHGMAYDAQRRQVVLFGGRGTSSTRPLGDTWVWDGKDWKQLSPTHRPTARFSQTMAYDPVHGEVILFGGNDGEHFLNDTWLWNGDDWTKVSPKGTIPEVRTDAAMDYDPVSGKMVLFSGSVWDSLGIGVPSDESWTWDGVSWTKLNTSQFKIIKDFTQLTRADRAHALVANGTPSLIWLPAN